MSEYIDGFVFPVPRDCLNEYKRLAAAVAEIWKEHGALDYREYVGDDMNLEGTHSFTDLVATNEDEVIVFGWVTFESREARDLAIQESQRKGGGRFKNAPRSHGRFIEFRIAGGDARTGGWLTEDSSRSSDRHLTLSDHPGSDFLTTSAAGP